MYRNYTTIFNNNYNIPTTNNNNNGNNNKIAANKQIAFNPNYLSIEHLKK